MAHAFACAHNPNNVEVEVLTANRRDLDLSDFSAIGPFLERAAPNLIVNAAAYTAVDQAETDSAQPRTPRV